MMPDERERVHISGIVVRIPPRHGIAIAAVHCDAPLGRRYVRGRRCNEFARDNALQPYITVFREALCGVLVLALQ